MNETKEKQFLIQAEHMCFSYPDDSAQVAPALNDVSLAIEKGSFVCLIGHNGSGKSTLAKLFNLILTPSSGRLCINGIDVTDHPLTDDEIFELRRNVGMVFQNPDNQLVATIVEEDIAFGPENLGSSTGRCGAGCCWDACISAPCSPFTIRRAEAACCHRGDSCNAAGMHYFG